MRQTLRKFRAVIDACDVPTPVFRSHIQKQEASLVSRALDFCESVDTEAVDATRLDLVAREGTMIAVLQLLDRVLSGSESRPSTPGTSASSSLQPLGAPEAAAANVLTRVFAVFLELAAVDHQGLGRTTTTQQLLPLLAAAQPCRLLALALQQAAPSPPSQPPTLAAVNSPAHKDLLLLSVWAAQAAGTMLKLVGRSPPFAAAFAQQLATAPHLWALVCNSLSRGLPDEVNSTEELFDAFRGLHGDEARDWPGFSDPCAPALFAALCAEPALERLLLLSAGVPQPAQSHGWVVRTLFLWQTYNPIRRPSAVVPEAQHVIDLAQAMRGNGGPYLADNIVLLQLYQRLASHAGRQRAFPAVAAHAERALARAMHPPVADWGLDDDDGDGYEDLLFDFIRTSSTLPAMFMLGLSSMQGDDPQYEAQWDGFRTRARWMTRRGMVTSIEAVVRETMRHNVATAPLAAHTELRCALDVAVLLMEEEQHGADALTACLSAIASARKVLLLWAAEVAGAQASSSEAVSAATAADVAVAEATPSAAAPVAAAAVAADVAALAAADAVAAAPACTASTTDRVSSDLATPSLRQCLVLISTAAAAAAACAAATVAVYPAKRFTPGTANRTSLLLGRPLPVAATVEYAAKRLVAPPVAPPAPAPPSETLLAGCIAFCHLLTHHKPLQARLRDGCPAAFTLLRYASLQLLPLAVRVAAQKLRATPQPPLDHTTWQHVLQLLYFLHSWGLADVTAALGFPALLVRVVRLLHRGDPSALIALEGVTRVVELADDSSAWLRQVERLSLLDALAACGAAVQSGAYRGVQAPGGMAWGSVLPAAVLQGGSGGGGAGDGDGDGDGCASANSSGSGGGVKSGEVAVTAAVPPLWLSGYLRKKRLRGILSRLQSCVNACQASGASTSGAAAASWDSAVLALLADERGLEMPGNVYVRPLLGCCHRRCINLSGPSEAALKLRRCGGCRLAGYCSDACQRKAWRSGLRAACLDWQRVGNELAVYDEE